MNFTFSTYYTDSNDVEHDIKVSYDYSPTEYNWPATIDVCEAINSDGVCVLDSLSKRKRSDIKEKCWEDYEERCGREQAMREDDAEARAEFMRENRLYELEQRLTHQSLKQQGEL